MPYTPPDDQVPDEDVPEDAHNRYEQRRQELQVRLTAQRILSTHLKPEEAPAVFWDDIDLNLTEAHLHQLDLTGCRIQSAGFRGAQFAGDAVFDRVQFAGNAGFHGAQFAGNAGFDGAQFAGNAEFGGAQFAGTAWFGGAQFAGNAGFHDTEFAGDAVFRDAEFAGTAWFGGAQFAGGAGFRGAQFAGGAGFDGARVARSRRVVLPKGWITRAAQPAEGEEEGWLYLVRDEDSSEQPAEAPGDGPA